MRQSNICCVSASCILAGRGAHIPRNEASIRCLSVMDMITVCLWMGFFRSYCVQECTHQRHFNTPSTRAHAELCCKYLLGYGRASFPTVVFRDVRMTAAGGGGMKGTSPSNLWSALSLSTINDMLSKPLTEEEVMFNQVCSR